MQYVTTFRIFKHNFWTNDWSRFLYEGTYYKFRAKHISKVKVRSRLFKKSKRINEVVFTIPFVWMNEYQKGVILPWTEFPKNLQKKLQAFIFSKAKILPKVLEKELKEYFVKKITITKKQAKALIKLQFKEGISAKELHAIHTRIGLSG